MAPCSSPAPLRRLRVACLAIPLTLFALPALAVDEIVEASRILSGLDAELHLTGMTFVGTRSDDSHFVLHAARAHFHPDSSVARLEQVEVEGRENEQRRFEVRCDHGELDVETNDFLAEGDVRGTTGDGRRYRAPWVRYDHDDELLYTDAPVLLQDDAGTFRGDGFRYHVAEQRFRLVGNVSVVQEP